MAVGQVDVLVGVPTLNNAAHRRPRGPGGPPRVRHPLPAPAHGAHQLRRRLHRRHAGDRAQRVARDAETLIAPQACARIHRISAPYHGLPGKASALRTLFAAADLLQARAVAFFDADVTSIEPDWVARLVRPVHQDGYDFVAPVYARHPFDGPLVTQLAAAAGARRLRPRLQRAAGRRVRLLGPFRAPLPGPAHLGRPARALRHRPLADRRGPRQGIPLRPGPWGRACRSRARRAPACRTSSARSWGRSSPASRCTPPTGWNAADPSPSRIRTPDPQPAEPAPAPEPPR